MTFLILLYSMTKIKLTWSLGSVRPIGGAAVGIGVLKILGESKQIPGVLTIEETSDKN